MSESVEFKHYPIGGGGLSVEIKVSGGPDEADLHGHDLLRRGIVLLVEEFDTHFVEKTQGYSEGQYYYASILSALARHYMVDDVEDREITVRQAIAEMVEHLVESGLLQETVTSGPGENDW